MTLRLATENEIDPIAALEALYAGGNGDGPDGPDWFEPEDGEDALLCREFVVAPEDGEDGVHVSTGWRLGFARIAGELRVVVQRVVEVWTDSDVSGNQVTADGPVMPLRAAPYGVRLRCAALRELRRGYYGGSSTQEP